MHTSVEALTFNLAFALVFIARIKKFPLLDSRFKKCLADFILLIFAFMLITDHSKTGQFLFIMNLFVLIGFAFQKKRWKIAGGSCFILILVGIFGLHFFGMGMLGRFARSVHVVQEIRSQKQEVTNDGSLLPRLYCWNTAIEMAKEKPILGFGIGFSKEYKERFAACYPNYREIYSHPHNQFLSVLVSNGAIGLLVFLLFWVQAVRLVWKNRRLWGWIWLLSLFLLCCIEVILKFSFLLYVCLPYCFLMVEYHNRKKIPTQAESLAPKP